MVVAVAVAGALASGSALADKPSWAGGGKSDKHENKGKQGHNGAGRDGGAEIRFGDDYRVQIRDYYAGEYRGGKCPPGLAKKRNGCMPPGQAKKWQLGRPLPGDVVIYDLPRELVVRVGIPPAGYRYARVGADILMIAIGTNMVVDAITDLGR